MDILVFIVPFAILIAVGFLVGFIWATKNGQYDDLETPAYKIILEDQHIDKNKSHSKREML